VPLGNRPLLMLLEHDRGDERQDGSVVRERPDCVGAPADLVVHPLERVRGPDRSPVALSEALEKVRDLLLGFGPHGANRWQLAGKGVDHLVVLGAHRGSRPEKWCSAPLRDPPWILRRQRRREGVFRAVVGVGEPYRSDLGKGFQAHVTAPLGPLLGLADEERAHEADVRGSTLEDAHHLPAPADLLVQALLEGWYSRSGARAR